MSKTYALWSSKGPIAVGDLDALKTRGERLVTEIVGTTQFKWELAEKVKDDDPENQLRMTRKAVPDRWLKMPYFIDEVPVLEESK